MNGMIKKYLPYAVIIFGVYLLVPLIFLIPGINNFSSVAYYFIFLVTQVACSAFYCSKHGLDFLFALIAPIAFLFTMMIYAGGFSNVTNIILLVVYLIAGIFGLFLGDLAFGDERRKREKKEKQAAEEMLLQAKRHDEREREKQHHTREPQRAANRNPQRIHTEKRRHPQNAEDKHYISSERIAKNTSGSEDDAFMARYTSEIDKNLNDRVNRLLDDE